MAEPRILVPAAQYVRVSTERQEYSLDCQFAGISQYAQQNGFVVCQTYCDEAKSGLVITHRTGLSSEGSANVKVGSTGLGELGGNFGKACQDDGHAQRRDYHCDRAGSPEQARELARHTKDATADNAVDDQSGHCPAPDRPNKSHRSPHIVWQSLPLNQSFECFLNKGPRCCRKIAITLRARQPAPPHQCNA